MAEVGVYNDGGLEYGGAIITVTPAAGGATFDCVSQSGFNPKNATTRVENVNKFGVPTKAFGIKKTINGSDVFQLPSGKTIMPGDSFVADQTGSKVYIVHNADNPFENEGYRKQSVEYYEKLN